jgi:F0F1-type ATP synthase assembly protein I
MNVAKDTTNLKQLMFQASDGIIGAAILVAVGVFAGRWLDDKLHTTPWLTVVLAVIGSILGLARLVKKAIDIGNSSPPPDPRKFRDATNDDEAPSN